MVEEAVLREFERISDRGGVLGAMESMYQRGKIQEESMHYEHLKHSGELPVIGVNTFQREGGNVAPEVELMRGTEEEKERQLQSVARFHARHQGEAAGALARLQQAARTGDNLFDELLLTVRHCTLGQITTALFEVGGQYRRNM